MGLIPGSRRAPWPMASSASHSIEVLPSFFHHWLPGCLCRRIAKTPAPLGYLLAKLYPAKSDQPRSDEDCCGEGGCAIRPSDRPCVSRGFFVETPRRAVQESSFLSHSPRALSGWPQLLSRSLVSPCRSGPETPPLLRCQLQTSQLLLPSPRSSAGMTPGKRGVPPDITNTLFRYPRCLSCLVPIFFK